ncbi:MULTISPECIES: RHS repeat-associated core domain-containing protein [Pseudomonas]|uniref:RHS repeat-associated core domain-containing protein n=1 Tax=Pseudomonas TaxID=286 RepID=UPI001EDD2B1B|nr:RHS repeat-associated core domain-containing protein [Pseudomonas shirazica]
MSTKNLDQQFFYMDGRPHNLKTPTGSRTLLRNHQNILAEWESDIESPAKLYLTDESASVLKRSGCTERPVAYTPYGNISNAPETGTFPGYNGELLLIELGLYLLGIGHNRPLSVRHLRFICPDTLSPFNLGGINAYSYCGNDPINNIDPSGHIKIWKTFRNIFFGRKKSLTRQVNTYNTELEARSKAIINFEIPSPRRKLSDLEKSKQEMLTNQNNLPKVHSLSNEAKKFRHKHYILKDKNLAEHYRILNEQTKQAKDTIKAAFNDIDKEIDDIHRAEKKKWLKDRKKNPHYKESPIERVQTAARDIREPKGHFQWEM